METLSELLALLRGIYRSLGDFLHKRQLMRSFDVFVAVNRLRNKNSVAGDLSHNDAHVTSP